MDCVRMSLLWGGWSDKTTMHLMKWSEKLKLFGDLGLLNLENRNWALFVKWWRRFGENKALWRKVIMANYGEGKWVGCPSLVLEIVSRVFEEVLR